MLHYYKPEDGMIELAGTKWKYGRATAIYLKLIAQNWKHLK